MYSSRLAGMDSYLVSDPMGNTTGMLQGTSPDFKPIELFVYGGIQQNVILYNALLSGQFRESVYTVRHRPFVTEWRYGIGLNIRWHPKHWINGVRISIGGNGRTKEFYGGLERRHQWGGVGLEFMHL